MKSLERIKDSLIQIDHDLAVRESDLERLIYKLKKEYGISSPKKVNGHLKELRMQIEKLKEEESGLYLKAEKALYRFNGTES